MKTVCKKPAATPAKSHGTSRPFINAKARDGFFGGTSSFVNSPAVQPSLRIGRKGDRYEREADAVADHTVRMSSFGQTPSIQTATGNSSNLQLFSTTSSSTNVAPVLQRSEGDEDIQAYSEEDVQARFRDEESPAVQAQEDESVQARALTRSEINNPLFRIKLKTAIRGGHTLGPGIRLDMEHRFGRDFHHVRIHTDTMAAQLADDLSAYAFTYGSHVFFAAGKYQPFTMGGKRLLAHELTHVVQQGEGVHLLQCAETALPSLLVQRDETGTPASATPARQSDEQESGGIWSGLVASASSLAWGIIRLLPLPASVITALHSIQQKGIIGYFRDALSDVATSLFDRLDNSGIPVIQNTMSTFRTIYSEVSTIVTAMANNDCQPLYNAVDSLKEKVSETAGDIWNSVTNFLEPVGDRCSDLWSSYGTPAVDWICTQAGDFWNWLTQFASDIWNQVKGPLGDAWTTVKGWFGISEGDAGTENEGGFTDWIMVKLGEAWAWIQETFQPILQPIQDIISRIGSLLPLDAIKNMRQSVIEWTESVTAMTGTLGERENVAQEQTSLREDILPAVKNRVRGLRTSITSAGSWICGKISELADAGLAMLAGLGAVPLLGSVIGRFQWLPDTITGLREWAQTTVTDTFAFIGNGLVRLSEWIEPVLDTLNKVFEVLGDLAGKIGDLVFGRAWRMIPPCIRDPLVNFLIENILKNIPIFGQLMEVPDLWTRISSIALRILRQVFVEGNLAGAAWTFFSEVLNIIGIPPELVLGIIGKAAQAIGDILRDPIGFLINLVKALVGGVVRFCDNIGTHLLHGITGWLFGQLQSANISPLTDLSFRSIIGFVFEILDLTRERIFQRMERHPRIGPRKVARLRGMFTILEGVWRWVSVLINEGPAGLWRELRERLGNIWNTILQSLTGFITERIIAGAIRNLAPMCDPTGIGAVITIVITVYSIIQSAVQYARPLLEMVNNFLNGINSIARGAIGPAARFLENCLGRALPIAIGFLANWLGLGGLGRRIQEIIRRVRVQVDRGIDWLINRGVRVIDRMLRMGRNAVAAVSNWLQINKPLRTQDGESHHIFFRRRGRNVRLVIASNNPTTYLVYIQQMKSLHNIVDNDQNYNNAKNTAENIDTKIAAFTAITSPSRQQEQQHNTEVAHLVDILVDYTATLPFNDNSGTNTSPVYGPLRLEFGTFARVSFQKAPHNDGSEPSVSNGLIFTLINRRMRGGGRLYVKGHLLNRWLNGPGNTWCNLTPLSQQANSDHKNNFENRVKDAVNGARSGIPSSQKGSMKNFEVRAVYENPNLSGLVTNLRSQSTPRPPSLDPTEDTDLIADIIEAERYVPHHLICSAIIKGENDTQEHTISETRIINDICYGDLSQYHTTGAKPEPLNLNTASINEMSRLPYLIRPHAEKIYDTIQRKKPAKYRSYGSLATDCGPMISVILLRYLRKRNLVVLR